MKDNHEMRPYTTEEVKKRLDFLKEKSEHDACLLGMAQWLVEQGWEDDIESLIDGVVDPRTCDD